MFRVSILRVGLCALLMLAVAPLPAQEQKPSPAPVPARPDVALALVLAVDASGSVSNDRFELQKQGYAAAFRNRRVLNSIQSLTTQSIAVTMMQWTGPELHVQTVDWTLVKDEASVNALADAIEASKRQLFGGGTSINGAIDYSRFLLTASPFLGIRRVIDISGDGANNRGRAVTLARDEAVSEIAFQRQRGRARQRIFVGGAAIARLGGQRQEAEPEDYRLQETFHVVGPVQEGLGLFAGRGDLSGYSHFDRIR